MLKKFLEIVWEMHVLTAVELGAPFKCNYSLTPFAPNSLRCRNGVAYSLCLQGHRQKDGACWERHSL